MSEIVARRSTADGKHVCLWSDGSLTWALGEAVRGAWFEPKPEQRERALKAGWLLLGSVEVYDATEVEHLARASRWAADRDGLPATMRERFAKLAAPPTLRPKWLDIERDHRGVVLERVWRLPALSAWAGYAVWDFCSRGTGRYVIMCRAARSHGRPSRRGDESFEPTGLTFDSQRELLSWMTDNPPRLSEQRSPPSD